MKIPISDAAAIGKVVRVSRKAQRLRQDDAAGSIGVSEYFLGKVERGSPSVQCRGCTQGQRTRQVQ
jgi:DNA-binding XRE family transcriptional regulator